MPQLPWTEIAAALGSLILIAIGIATQWLRRISRQFRNDGNGSMRSAIDRLEGSSERIETGIAANRSRIMAMFADSAKAIWEADAKGDCLRMNRAGLEMAGRQFSEIRGRAWPNLIHPEDRAKVVKEWDLCVADHRPFEMKYRWIHRTGTPICVSAHSHPILNPANEVVGWVGVCVPQEPEQC